MLALIGDTHADRSATTLALHAIAERDDIERVIQLGDFGYFPAMALGRRFLEAVEATCADLGITLEFIDGNHDDHDALAALDRDELGRGVVSEHIRHLPRGFRFEIDGADVLAFGGAVSVDRNLRTPGRDWWPNEVASYREYTEAMAGGRADVILAHERPLVGSPVANGMHIPADTLADAHANARAMMSLAREVGASMYVHGHHHVRYSDEVDGLHIEGLGMNGAPLERFVALFDPITHTLRSGVARGRA